MGIGDRVRRARLSKGMSQSALAKRIGVTPQSIQSLEAGKVANPRNLSEIAEALDVTDISLRFDNVHELTAASEIGGKVATEAPNATLIDHAIATIPIIGRVEAGSFRVVDDGDEPLGYIPFIKQGPTAHAKHFALVIVGDSVNEYADDGDIAVCAAFWDLGWSYGSFHERFVVCHKTDGDKIETTIKQFFLDGTKVTLRPRSKNKKHKDIVIDADEFSDENGRQISITGVVVAFQKQML